MMERRPGRPDRNSRFRLARAFSVDQRLGLRRLLVRCGREVERISQGYEAENAEYRKNHHMLLYARCIVRLPGKMNGADLLSIVRIRACLSSPGPSPSKGRHARDGRRVRPSRAGGNTKTAAANKTEFTCARRAAWTIRIKRLKYNDNQIINASLAAAVLPSPDMFGSNSADPHISPGSSLRQRSPLTLPRPSPPASPIPRPRSSRRGQTRPRDIAGPAGHSRAGGRGS